MDPSTINTGMDVLRAGLGVHLAAIAIYVALSSQFAYSVWSKKGRWNHIFFELQSSTRFKTFLIGSYPPPGAMSASPADKPLQPLPSQLWSF